MLRIILWTLIWLASLGAADITVKYEDGLSLTYEGWLSSIGRRSRDDTNE